MVLNERTTDIHESSVLAKDWWRCDGFGVCTGAVWNGSVGGGSVGGGSVDGGSLGGGSVDGGGVGGDSQRRATIVLSDGHDSMAGRSWGDKPTPSLRCREGHGPTARTTGLTTRVTGPTRCPSSRGRMTISQQWSGRRAEARHT